MHRQPLIRLQSGAAAHVTDFNDRLRQDLDLIGAKHSGFTLHAIRNQDIAEAHEDPNMRNDSISLGVGHSSCHTNNYKGCALLLGFSNHTRPKPFPKCCSACSCVVLQVHGFVHDEQARRLSRYESSDPSGAR
jgi:hypothetical protein